MPGDSGVTVVTNSCAFYIMHARLRVHRAPGIPHALYFRAEDFMHNSGESRRENAEVCLTFVVLPSANAHESRDP